MAPARVARRPLGSVATFSPPDRPALHAEIASLVARLRAALCGEEWPGDAALAVRARVTPLAANGQPRDSRDVRLRELNEWGLSFEHPAPLADRRALVSVECPKLGAIEAEIELSWCRYNEGGRYTSGGRFVQLVAPPT